MRYCKFVFCILLIPTYYSAQDTSVVKVYGCVEPYFCYDFNNPSNHTRPANIYSFNRHNEVSLNMGMLGVAVADSTYRCKIALMSGSYAAANLSNERPIFQHIFEANAGIRLFKRNNVWLDAGVLPSHIGFESAIGATCPTLSRSILADNTPYFETGIKLSATSVDERWSIGILAVNGWQRIEQRNGNSLLSGGTQITFSPNDKLLFNSSTFVGTDEPDSTRKYRYFHNFYCIWNVAERFQITAGFDIGIQQVNKNALSYDSWHSAVLISRYKFNTKFAIALRGEYYHDPHNIIVSGFSPREFSVFSFSSNFDYAFDENVLFRIELRTFHSESSIYTRKGVPVSDNAAICGAICIKI